MATADTEIVNLGKYYTPAEFVDIVWELIRPYLRPNTIVFDPACGTGNFLDKQLSIKIHMLGNDIDPNAIEIAKSRLKGKDIRFTSLNLLSNPNRESFGIPQNAHLIIVGNPPYNDVTSKAKKKLKKLAFDVRADIRSRDIGISFLKAFTYLRPDIISVLHPLSYLIKPANFRLLKPFNYRYKLLDGVIIPSSVFNHTGKTVFPILITLYKRDLNGMTYDYIRNFTFRTFDGKKFRIADFDYIGNYVRKYPTKNTPLDHSGLYFYTMRDINALRRNTTFVHKDTPGAIPVARSMLDFYIYVDIFKDFIHHVPYYFGNLDIPIDLESFNQYKKYFISFALRKYAFLRKFYPEESILPDDEKMIETYFRKLLGEHFHE